MTLPENKSFWILLLLYSIYMAGGQLLSSLFEVYFFGLGLDLTQIIFSVILVFVPPILVISLLRTFELKKGITVASIFWILAIIILYIVQNPIAPYVARLLIGMSIFFFWMPFNTYFYSFTKNNAAFMGSIYYSISPLLALIVPVMAGIIAGLSGFPNLFLISGGIFVGLIALNYVWGIEKEYRFDLNKAIKSIDGLKTLTFMEGFSINTIVPVTLSTMTLLYFKEPLGFGGFLSATTLFAILASFITSKISDHYKDRRNLLIFSSLGFFLSAVFTSLADSASAFFIGFGAISFFRGILQPLPFALAIDKSKSLPETIIGREIMLNLGRCAAILAGTILMIFMDIKAMLIAQTLAAAAYLIVFEIKKEKLNI